jgi:hypothetical protein
MVSRGYAVPPSNGDPDRALVPRSGHPGRQREREEGTLHGQNPYVDASSAASKRGKVPFLTSGRATVMS